MSHRFLVYALLDPRDNAVRYVGKSSTGMRRPNDHVKSCYRKASDYKTRWVNALLTLGLRYRIVVLEYCSSNEQALERECVWIAQGRQAGWALTNLTNGGQGLTGFVVSPETRAKQSAASKGKPKSPEHRAAMSIARTGWTTPPETRAKQSAVAKARVASDPAELERLRTLRSGAANSPAAREKLRLANTGLVHSEERRAINARAQTGRKRSEDSRRKQAETMRQIWSGNWAVRRRTSSPDPRAVWSKPRG